MMDARLQSDGTLDKGNDTERSSNVTKSTFKLPFTASTASTTSSKCSVTAAPASPDNTLATGASPTEIFPCCSSNSSASCLQLLFGSMASLNWGFLRQALATSSETWWRKSLSSASSLGGVGLMMSKGGLSASMGPSHLCSGNGVPSKW